MEEYTAHELAEDSDDKKRLEKAEKVAERKAVLRKRKCTHQPAGRHPPQFLQYPALPYRGYAYPQHLQQTGVGAGAGTRRPGPSSSPLVQRAVGPCFACGEMGHLSTYCPKMQPLEKKWYPSMQRHESVQDVCTVCRRKVVLV